MEMTDGQVQSALVQFDKLINDYSKLTSGWQKFIENESKQDYWLNLMSNLRLEYSNCYRNYRKIYPAIGNIFNAFTYCDPQYIKCVLSGQDPYHGAKQAHGLSFSVQKGVVIPPSLRNIYKEIRYDLGIEEASHGRLESWAKQGVLLLNSILTVEEGKPGSHKDFGWQEFTDNVLCYLAKQSSPKVFLLWGSFAKQKKELIEGCSHLILEAAHPSPFSANNGFFGCKHFSRTNAYMRDHNLEEIDWKII